ncbi:MAG: ATP-binding protein, partial [Gammaproteobacteria bacterium]
DEFANKNQANIGNVGIGCDYLAVCRNTASHTEDIAGRAYRGIKSVLEKQRPFFTMEYPCHSSEQQRWFLMSVVPLLGEAGGAVVAHMNITERKEIENQLVTAKNEAEQASRTKSEFLSRMSHELRTPLNAILGYSQLMLMDDMFNDDQLKSIDEINKAGKHLLHLISDLLDLAKIEAGRMQLNFEDLPLEEIIEECHRLVSPIAERRNISITCCNNRRCCNAAVHADRVRLKQVILNILSNAVKYNRDNGKVSLDVEQVDNYLRLSIKDTGEGIPEQHMHKLFSAFNRLGAESTTIEGTGIGLVIAKNLIELMGGQIQVQSQTGHGTTFQIDILSANVTNRVKDLKLSPQVEEYCPAPANGSAYTILYIEDNPANTRLVEHVLKRRPNLKVLTASQGPQGLKMACVEKPDLVLLDITLPGMDGYEVLCKLQDSELTQHIPVIAVSANAMNRDVDRGLNAGFAHYITKPIDVNKLLSAVDHILDLKQGAA